MILFEALVWCLLVSLLTGGSLRQLEHENLRAEWVLLVLLPLQLVWPTLSRWIGLPCDLSIVLWLLMMSALAVVLFINAPRRWMLAFAGLGIALNVLVIGVNGAMPVSMRAVSEIGALRENAKQAMSDDCLHEELDQETALSALADVVAVPGPAWQRSVVSAGDLLLAAGLGAWVFVASRREPGVGS